MDSLAKLLAFNELVIDKPEEEKVILAQHFGIDYEEYKRRIIGKEKEAEFVAIMKSLGALKHFEAFDEGLSHITEEYTPDFNIEMSDGYKLMLEVKHTDNDYYKISGGNLQKRIDFATRHEVPLRFAVSIKGYWGLFTSDTLRNKNGKLVIDDFIGKSSYSYFDRELETCSYMFNKPIKIISIYACNYSKGMEVKFEPHGKLVSYELYYDNKKIIRAKGKDSKFIRHSLILEALQDRIANTNQKIQRDGDFTIITETTEGNPYHTIPEYKFLLAPIYHMRKLINGKEIQYNASLAVSDRDFHFIPIEAVRITLSELVDRGVDITVFKDSIGYPFKEYAKNFWTKSKRST